MLRITKAGEVVIDANTPYSDPRFAHVRSTLIPGFIEEKSHEGGPNSNRGESDGAQGKPDEGGLVQIPIELDEDSDQVAAAQAFKTLARILQEAREQKLKKEQEEMERQAQKEEHDIFLGDVKPITVSPDE